MRSVRIFSIQRSGSNYLEYLLMNNYEINVIGRGKGQCPCSEKHCRIEDVNPHEPFLILCRSPISWAVSFHRFSHHFSWYEERKTFRDMLPWYAFIWTDMHRNWYPRSTMIVRYEDVLSHPQKTLDEVARTFYFERKGGVWKDTRFHLHFNPKNEGVVFDRTRAVDEYCAKLYEPEDLKNFLNCIDIDLLYSFGYASLMEKK